MKIFLALLAILFLPPSALAANLVDQLTSYLAYETHETAEECPGGGCYHFHRAARLSKQLTVAIAAQNAGTPGTPVTGYLGGVFGYMGVWDADGKTIPGTFEPISGGGGGVGRASGQGGNYAANPTGRNSR